MVNDEEDYRQDNEAIEDKECDENVVNSDNVFKYSVFLLSFLDGSP